MEAIKIYLIGGRIIEISDDTHYEAIRLLSVNRNNNWLIELKDLNGLVHHFYADKIIEIVKPK